MLRQPPHWEHIRIVAVCAFLLSGSSGFADGIITRRGHLVAQQHADAHDADSEARSGDLLRAVTGLGFGVVTSIVGATRSGLAGGVAVDIVSVRYPLGGGDIGKLQALSGPNSAAHLGFTLVNLPAVFSCRAPNGSLHAPILGHMLVACVPGARLGIGATLGELSWHPAQRRRTARWADLAAVINLLGATSSMAYLRGHLDASLRFGVDSVWHGTDESRTGADHIVRGGVALDGVIRSNNAHWEATLQVAFRPTLIGTVASFRDWGCAAEATALYHGSIDSTVISIGLDLRAAYWSDPSTSVSSIDATRASPAVFAGAVLRVKRESKP